jgi:hypothetical protein
MQLAHIWSNTPNSTNLFLINDVRWMFAQRTYTIVIVVVVVVIIIIMKSSVTIAIVSFKE